MKIRARVKDVKTSFGVVVCVPYCNLSTLLSREDPFAYTAGVDGWHADIYSAGYTDNGAAAIVTGYQAFGNVKPSYELTRQYEKAARRVLDTSNGDYKTEKGRLYELIRDFIGDALKEAENRKTRR